MKCAVALFCLMLMTLNAADSVPIQSLPAIPPDVRLTTLENGLTLIIRADHSAPVVSVQAWCKAGSINEGPWLGAGLSHVLRTHALQEYDPSRAGRHVHVGAVCGRVSTRCTFR